MLHVDYEYNRVTHKYVNLVCCTTFDTKENEPREWWLHNDTFRQIELADYLRSKKDEIFFGYATTAESRSFEALGLNPVEFKWIDGFLEYRCLTNHNDELAYGEQLVDGKVKRTAKPPPKWQRTEEDKSSGFKPKHNLAEATFKLTGKIRDTEHKNRMRDLIISDPPFFDFLEQQAIQQYCTEDTIFLPEMFDAILGKYKKLLGRNFNTNKLMKEMLLRGKYSALTARMETRGYPIDYNKTKNFSTSVGPLLEECQREINQLFPEVMPFKYNRSLRKFSMDTKAVKSWIQRNVDADRWMKTEGGKTGKKDLSLSLDAWTMFFDFKHSYPKENFGAQMVRYLKLKQNLNGFTPSTGKRNFWDAVGPDQRVRPYFNHYGSQSSRSQPSSTSFLFLKPAWMRALCVPPKGRCIASIDYGSEEFFLSALMSKDKNMIDAYLSGDVYLYFAKLAGAVPMDGKREDYKKERNIFKAVTLSISYLQTAKGLSKKLTEETGEEFSEEDAQDLINKFYEVYDRFAEWQSEMADHYEEHRRVELPCGYFMWGDNDNFRSVANVPIQGFGASVMRKAVELAEEAGVEVVVTLHDALYIEYDFGDYSAIDKLIKAMREAFQFYFTDPEIKELSGKIKMDIFSWGPDLPAPVVTVNSKGKEEKEYGTITTPDGIEVEVADIYVDSRAEEEFKQFSKYFLDRIEDTYL